jgi:hypothetical protein
MASEPLQYTDGHVRCASRAQLVSITSSGNSSSSSGSSSITNRITSRVTNTNSNGASRSRSRYGRVRAVQTVVFALLFEERVCVPSLVVHQCTGVNEVL